MASAPVVAAALARDGWSYGTVPSSRVVDFANGVWLKWGT